MGLRLLMRKRRATDIICLELCRALDATPHDMLASKVGRHGFGGWILVDNGLVRWSHSESKAQCPGETSDE